MELVDTLDLLEEYLTARDECFAAYRHASLHLTRYKLNRGQASADILLHGLTRIGCVVDGEEPSGEAVSTLRNRWKAKGESDRYLISELSSNIISELSSEGLSNFHLKSDLIFKDGHTSSLSLQSVYAKLLREWVVPLAKLKNRLEMELVRL